MATRMSTQTGGSDLLTPHLSTDDLIRLAEHHLAELSESEISHVNKTLGLPGARHVGWRLRREWTRLGLLVEALVKTWRSPRHLLGRLHAHWHVISKRGIVDPRVLLSLLSLAGAIVPQIVVKGDTALKALLGAGLGAGTFGLVALLWSEYVACPVLEMKLRHRIAKRPERILPSTLGATKAEIVPHQDPLTIIPRSELYDEVIPGIISRHHKDVQIVVGDPGAGKTTALVGLARVLARIGLIPVLVPLRGESTSNIVEKAKAIFERQLDLHVRSHGQIDTLWRWLYQRKRIVVLIDDMDQIGPDGERGFVVRRRLESLETENLPVVVTARPAGIPAGVAAAAIHLGELEEADVVAALIRAAEDDPGVSAAHDPEDRQLLYWVRQGRLTEVPFYLELLALLAASGPCPTLPAADPLWVEQDTSGRCHQRPDGTYEWNPLWVRFLLLENYFAAVRDNQVRRWLGIEASERESMLRALSDAALGTLLAVSVEARERGKGNKDFEAKRHAISDFIDTDDRGELKFGMPRRRNVSANEVIDAGERLRLLELDHDGQPQFRHRIMQAYLAGRRLAELCDETGPDAEFEASIGHLLDHYHPEKLTTHMTLTFAALQAFRCSRRTGDNGDLRPGTPGEDRREVAIKIVTRLHEEAGKRLAPPGPGTHRTADRGKTMAAEATAVIADAQEFAVLALAIDADGADQDRHRGVLDPEKFVDPEARRDPDDALTLLTTAAEILAAIARRPRFKPGRQAPAPREALAEQARTILEDARNTQGATRWTKLRAIDVFTQMAATERWQRIWDYTTDPDYQVRRAASAALQDNALEAYAALKPDIEIQLTRAGARSALGFSVDKRIQAAAGHRSGDGSSHDWRTKPTTAEKLQIWDWTDEYDVLPLRALGWVLPAIVSGLGEDPAAQAHESWGSRRAPTDDAADSDSSLEEYSSLVRSARTSLQQLVTLAVEGHHPDLEATLAQGFRGDAMRHLDSPQGRFVGAGWVASNRWLVNDICLGRAEFWYARMVFHQALALYAIAGANPRETLETWARTLHRGGERHPFTARAAKLARRGLERRQCGSDRWRGLIWEDEGKVAARRPTVLSDAAARLVADVTLLLDLNEGSSQDRQAQFALMRELPYCLAESRDRNEILGSGCPASCGWGMCPYKLPPPDEPNSHRGVSRAFCRHQQQIARQPRWQRNISRRRIRNFWRRMERRVRS